MQNAHSEQRPGNPALLHARVAVRGHGAKRSTAKPAVYRHASGGGTERGTRSIYSSGRASSRAATAPRKPDKPGIGTKLRSPAAGAGRHSCCARSQNHRWTSIQTGGIGHSTRQAAAGSLALDQDWSHCGGRGCLGNRLCAHQGQPQQTTRCSLKSRREKYRS